MKSSGNSIFGMSLLTIGALVLLPPSPARGGESSEGRIVLTESGGNSSKLEISGPLAMQLFFSLDPRREIVQYTASCSAKIPGCATRVGKNIYCSNGDLGEPELNYRCFIEVSDVRSGEFATIR